MRKDRMQAIRFVLLAAIAVGFLIVPSCSIGGDREVLKTFEALKNLIISVSEEIKPSVVHIEVVQKRDAQKFEVLGSGLIVDEQGHILTNDHVVDKAQSIKVTLQSKLEYPAVVVGVDKQTDLALIKIDCPERLKVARLGDSDKVQVGEWVIAVGNPYGFDRTVSFGIVSGKGRVLQLPTQTPFLSNFIQTDAAIDPGSSGGPLVNLRGEVIGINSIGYGRGQGFTVPINIAIEVKEKLLATGNIDRGWLGIFMQPLSREFAEYFGNKSLQGILVSDLMSDSPAGRAGLLPGDIITSFNGQVVSAEKREDLNQFQLLVSSTTVGSEVSLDIIRDGNEARVKVGVGLQPKIKPEELELEDLGFTVQEITDQIFRRYMLEDKRGVFVSYVEVGGVARTGQLMEADIVKFVEDEEVTDLGSFKEVLDANQHKRLILLKVKRGKAYRWVLLNREENTLK